jgi:hypothetical protein
MFEVGQKVKTRTGLDARILCTDIEDPSDLMLPARDVWVVLHASGCLEIYEIEEFAKKPTDIVCRRKVVMQPGQFDN